MMPTKWTLPRTMMHTKRAYSRTRRFHQSHRTGSTKEEPDSRKLRPLPSNLDITRSSRN